jgi:hypothetical protein
MAGINHELFPDFGVHFNFVRKLEYNWWATFNDAEPFLAFRPVAGIDLGRDGVRGTADDKPFTIFERMVPARVENALRNEGGGHNFSTFEVGATKRMSRNWQMITGFDWTKRNLKNSSGNDPNTLFYGADSGVHTKYWTYKLIGSYQLPRGISISGTYNAQKGEAYGRRQTFSGASGALFPRTANLAQGSPTVYVEPIGTYYYPTTHLTNLRVEKTFQIGDRQRISGMFDLFNIFNVNTVIGVDTLTGVLTDRQTGQRVPRFDRPTQIVQPRIFRLGVRYLF